jgi:hypothetical protein
MFCGVNASFSRNFRGVVLWFRPKVIKDIAGVCVAKKTCNFAACHSLTQACQNLTENELYSSYEIELSETQRVPLPGVMDKSDSDGGIGAE